MGDMMFQNGMDGMSMIRVTGDGTHEAIYAATLDTVEEILGDGDEIPEDYGDIYLKLTDVDRTITELMRGLLASVASGRLQEFVDALTSTIYSAREVDED